MIDNAEEIARDNNDVCELHISSTIKWDEVLTIDVKKSHIVRNKNGDD